MPYLEDSLEACVDPMNINQFLSAQPCQKENTVTSAAKFLEMSPMSSLILFLILRLMNLIDHDEVQSCKKSIEILEPSEPIETSTPKMKRSPRSNKDIPPTRYGSVCSHNVNISTKVGEWLNSISKKIDVIYYHVFD